MVYHYQISKFHLHSTAQKVLGNNIQIEWQDILILRPQNWKENSLYYRYSQYLGYVPEDEEVVEQEYLRLKLNKTESGMGRKKRLKNAKIWVKSVFRAEKKGFKVRNWEANKESMIEIVESYRGGQDRYWFKGKKRYNLTSEDLALIYYAIRKSNQVDNAKKVSSDKKYAFSYQQVRDTFMSVYNKGCHNDKISTILKVLKKAKLIKLDGNFKVKSHGNKYKAKVVTKDIAKGG